MAIYRLLTPPRTLALSFGLLILAGTAVLLLPGVARDPGFSFLDALFTATSAVCVTGLIVVDTGSAFSPTGQIAILTMIQLGGLGIMTFSVFFYRLVGRDLSLGHELAVKDTFSYLPHRDVPRLAGYVVLAALAIEGIGAVLLFLAWLPDHSWPQAAWLAVFHSVSAFCNAGFSLWADSLTGYRSSLPINLVVIGLIVMGGLGFIVLSDLFQFPRQGRRGLGLHTRIVLTASLALTAVGGLVFLTMEWNNVLAGLGWADKSVITLFQAVTPRTAGFNTVDYAQLTNATLLLTIFLMFVGGSPGSSAGGIKTVTLALLFALAWSRIRGFSKTNIFRRSVKDEIVSRSLTITLVGIAIIFMALIVLLMTQTGRTPHVHTRGAFISLLFETVSAFGTVGLSMGATPDLTATGKLTIIVTMFLGRVGPLTAAMALMRKSQAGKPYNYGVEDVMVG